MRIGNLRTLFIVAAAAFIAAAAGLAWPSRVEAAAVQIRPLIYRETVAPGENKKGFVDISNASATKLTVSLGVQGFRQTDGTGNLQFFASEALTKGIVLDLEEVELGPREAVRVYFLIDSTKLPKGDVFAAVFASTKPEITGGIASAARVGTLLVLENGYPGKRQAVVESLQVAAVHLGDGITGTVTVRNAAEPPQESGFFPKVTVKLTPVAAVQKQLEGPLVMTGIARTVPFDLQTNRIGIYKLAVSTGDSTAEKWLFLLTGHYRWAALAIAGVLAVFVVLLMGRRHRSVPIE